MWNKILFWIFAIKLCGVAFSGVYDDCEAPPPVNYSTVLLEESEDTVRVFYSCNAGYQMRGNSELICDFDTDEWNADPPICVLNEASNEIVDERKSPQIDQEENAPIKKKKVSDIVEAKSISVEFASILDMSCVSAKIKAPQIRNGLVKKYDRRKKGEFIFLVALYTCDDNYELEDPERSLLYCSERNWIGEMPVCVSVGEYEDEGGDYDTYEETGVDDEDDEVIDKVSSTAAIEPRIELDHESMIAKNEKPNFDGGVNERPTENPVTDINIVVEPTRDPYLPRVLNQSCKIFDENIDERCQHKCEVVLYPGENEPRFLCSCHEGFSLDPYDLHSCHDINECDEADIHERCPGGCDNELGSFKCHSEVNSESGNNFENEEQTTDKQEQIICQEGYRLETATGGCIDIDECSEGSSECEEICVNREGGFECECQTVGYKLNDDKRSCIDINECELPEKICSHECLNTLGSFVCVCEENFHLLSDQRMCARDTCSDLADPKWNKTRCTYGCIDHDIDEKVGVGGFQCTCPPGHKLDLDGRSCTALPDACRDMGGNENCFPGSCVSKNESEDENTRVYRCLCPPGFTNDDGLHCKDIDECVAGIHECSHFCHNLVGTYRCSCPNGFQTTEYNEHLCKDIDECESTAAASAACGFLQCVNIVGGFKCLCPDGSEADTSGACEIPNPCEKDMGGCSHLCVVAIDGITAECQCPANMVLADDQHNCTNFDPCAINNNGCEQICENQSGKCSCQAGYELSADDGRSCVDYDECNDNNAGCDQLCVNHPGGYECMCHAGFLLLFGLCLDIDECALDLHTCGFTSKCQNLNGSFVCECPKGFSLKLSQSLSSLSFSSIGSSPLASIPSSSFSPTSYECFDIDECALNNGNCSHSCLNTPGSFQCSCPEDQRLRVDDMRTCEEIDGCSINNGGCSHECRYDLKSGVSCACAEGYTLQHAPLKNLCVDIDECSFVTERKCSQICINTNGSFACSCYAGFSLSLENSRDCFDIDECMDENGNCSNICINLLGSFACACEAGFELNEDQRTCIDVDECSLGLHDCSHFCVNAVGGYECSCPAGYHLGQNKLSCVDIDECAITEAICSHFCLNTLGSFRCECPEKGFFLDIDNKTCLPADVCKSLRPGCSHFCENTNDTLVGYRCLCPEGMSLGHEDEFNCIDVNECEMENGGCSHICLNTEASFLCKCPTGFKLSHDERTCEDIDECLIGNGGCSHYCRNMDGGFACECDDGYHLNNEDRLTCEQNLDPCSRSGCEQICSNRGEEAICSCRDGYAPALFEPNRCEDIDECRINNGGCEFQCHNTIGSFECTCAPGFTRNPIKGECVDINECELQNGGCIGGECINYEGGFECKCPPGQKLSVFDGKTCTEVRDTCKQLTPPENGELQCTRFRHKKKFYYNTKCKVWCNPGYWLDGPSMRFCNSSGYWDDFENRCLPKICPRLPVPKFGLILPVTCSMGKTFMGERCRLQCLPGYVAIGKTVAVCTATQEWSTHDTLDCVALERSISRQPIASSHYHHNQQNRHNSVNRITRPYIRCPRNTTVYLSNDETTAHIILQKPITNFDFQYIESYPAWAKNLQAYLGAGTYTITFRGLDPISGRRAKCKTVITVRKVEPPKITFCPPSFEVVLAPGEMYQAIFWEEPQFDDASSGTWKKIYKSQIPGSLFGPGVHRIYYEATSEDNLSSRCEFNIIVKNVASQQPSPMNLNFHQAYDPRLFSDKISNFMKDHDPFIICPGQVPVRAQSGSSLELPPKCTVRNIRTNPIRQITRERHSTVNSQWKNYKII